MEETLQKMIRPVTECQMPLRKQKRILREMFAAAVSNTPEGDMDNFTAKRYAPVFLALAHLLDNVGKVKKKVC